MFCIFCFSYGSQSIPSPFHLSWMCLVEYLDLFTNEEVSNLIVFYFYQFIVTILNVTNSSFLMLQTQMV